MIDPNSNIRLATARKDGVALGLAMQDVKDILEGAPALVYAQKSFRFGRVKNGALEFYSGNIPDLIFEVRAFNERCELRWLARADEFDGTPNTLGDAVLLFEKIEPPAGWTEPTSGTGNPERFKAGKYILWKSRIPAGTQLPEGWAELYEHRIGSVFVPFPQEKLKGRLALTFVEYVAVNDPKDQEHGNCAVVAERLTGLTVVDLKRNQ